MIKNHIKTHKRALKSRISLGLRPRPLSCPLNPCKPLLNFQIVGFQPPFKFSLATPLNTAEILLIPYLHHYLVHYQLYELKSSSELLHQVLSKQSIKHHNKL